MGYTAVTRSPNASPYPTEPSSPLPRPGARPGVATAQTVQDPILGPVLQLLSTDNGHGPSRGPSDPTALALRCPPGQHQLRCPLPVVVFLLEAMGKYVSVEIGVTCTDGARRVLLLKNSAAKARLSPNCSTVPLRLDPGWNQVAIDLLDLVPKAFPGQGFADVAWVRVLASCRLARVFLAAQHDGWTTGHRVLPEMGALVPGMLTDHTDVGSPSWAQAPAHSHWASPARSAPQEQRTPSAPTGEKAGPSTPSLDCGASRSAQPGIHTDHTPGHHHPHHTDEDDLVVRKRKLLSDKVVTKPTDSADSLLHEGEIETTDARPPPTTCTIPRVT